VIRLIERWRQFSPRERWLIIEAATFLLWARLTFAALPLPVALRLMGARPGVGPRGRVAENEATDIGVAIVRASRYVPFRAVCLQQSFASLLMLRRRGLKASVHFGIRNGSMLAAHAWSSSGPIQVTGHALADDFVSIAVFTA